MEFDLLLKDISLDYCEAVGESAPSRGYKIFGFNKIWKQYTGYKSRGLVKRTVATAISVLTIAIIVLTVGTMASQDWSDSIFGQLRRLFDSELSMDEFSITEEEIASYTIQETGFKLLGAEYSTVPTLKEFLINGWKITSRGGVTGVENEDGSVDMYTSSYKIEKGDSNILIGISGTDAISDKKVKDCRISYIKISKDIINLDNEYIDSNLDSFLIDDINLLNIDFEALDNYLVAHISHNKTANIAEASEGFDNFDTYIYMLNGTPLEHTGIFDVEYDVQTNGNICNTVTVYFNAYFRD